MLDRITTILGNMRASRLIALAVLLALILFLALNVLVTNLGRNSRIDLTENNLYSLSDGTRSVLSALEEPLHFRLFLSSDLVTTAPQLAAFANRVKEILDSYVSLSGGKISLEVIDPKPFSDDEDRAVGLGINRFGVGGNPKPLFFGLAATNSTNSKGAIPVFAPEREPNLEYDLTRLVSELGTPGKIKVAIIDGLGLAGNPGTGLPPQQVNVQMRQFFDIQTLLGDVDELPADTRVVLVVHPQRLSDRTLYTLDQWALSGGATLIFVDPYAETQTGARPGMPPQNPASTLDKLFKAWGVTFDNSQAVADPTVALRTMRNVGGRQMQVANPQWLGLRRASFALQDPVVGELNNVFLTTAGSFGTTKEASVTLKPVLTASARAGTVSAFEAGSPQTDPRTLLQKAKLTDTKPVLAARVEGKLTTAFADGKPKDSQSKPTALSESAEPLNIMLFGDADMLMDRNWVQQRRAQGQTVAQAFANNGDLLLNAIEQMAGGAVLAGLRGREVAWRPFERIAALEQSAESKYLVKEQELAAKLRDAESKLRELSKDAKPGSELINAEGAKAIEQFRSNMLATRAELREVQFNLGREVQRLKSWVTALNVAVVPAVVAVLALLIALRRPRRSVPTTSNTGGSQ